MKNAFVSIAPIFAALLAFVAVWALSPAPVQDAGLDIAAELEECVISEAYAGDYGKCSFNSDCHDGVKCNSGKCADSEGSSCSFDSDCGGNGAKCHSGKCSNAPDGKCNFNSECPGGSCSSGKCKF